MDKLEVICYIISHIDLKFNPFLCTDLQYRQTIANIGSQTVHSFVSICWRVSALRLQVDTHTYTIITHRRYTYGWRRSVEIHKNTKEQRLTSPPAPMQTKRKWYKNTAIYRSGRVTSPFLWKQEEKQSYCNWWYFVEIPPVTYRRRIRRSQALCINVPWHCPSRISPKTRRSGV